MANKGHVTLSGLKHIFSLKSVLNLGLSDILKFIFNDLPPVVLPVYKLSSSPLHSFWVSGFVTGEGSFFVSVNSKNQVFPVFSIGLHLRDKLLLLKIQEYFGFASVYLSGDRHSLKFSNYLIFFQLFLILILIL